MFYEKPMFYHYLEYWRTAPNSTGCSQTFKVIGSAARTIDAAANERCKIATWYKPSQIISLSTHNVGTGPAVCGKVQR